MNIPWDWYLFGLLNGLIIAFAYIVIITNRR